MPIDPASEKALFPTATLVCPPALAALPTATDFILECALLPTATAYPAKSSAFGLAYEVAGTVVISTACTTGTTKPDAPTTHNATYFAIDDFLQSMSFSLNTTRNIQVYVKYTIPIGL